MSTPEIHPTEIMRRQSDYKPPRSLSHWLIGRPLMTADAPHQTIGKAVGLAVFASDALSSTAYATQEILVILAVAGTGAFGYAFPISLAIVGLLAVVTLSYQQTIHAYPGGGGAYIVARVNVGAGLLRYLTGSLGTVADPPALEGAHAAQVVTSFLILHAFSSGTAALTGVE